MASADRPAQNILLMRTASEQVESGDPFQLENRLYGDAGLYYHDGTNYYRLAQSNQAVDASYMSFGLATPVIDATGLGAAWRRINWFDYEIPPLNFLTDLANGEFQFQRAGSYIVTLAIAFSHDELNAGRETSVRLINTTLSQASVPRNIFTGRNTAGSNYSLTFLVEITAAQENDVYAVEIGNGDTYSAVEWQTTELSVYSVGVRS